VGKDFGLVNPFLNPGDGGNVVGDVGAGVEIGERLVQMFTAL
jgi:hypothetical protein